MGTWAAGPFSNDAAMDFVADLIDQLMEPVHAFVAEPQIDEGFDEAFAAIALLNAIMRQTSARPWHDDAVVDGAPIREAMLRCYDEQIDGLHPNPSFKVEQRAALVEALDTFVAELMAG